MQRLVIDVEDQYINLVAELLSNLERFRQLKAKSNNKTTLTMDMTINTDEMVNDGFLAPIAPAWGCMKTCYSCMRIPPKTDGNE